MALLGRGHLCHQPVVDGWRKLLRVWGRGVFRTHGRGSDGLLHLSACAYSATSHQKDCRPTTAGNDKDAALIVQMSKHAKHNCSSPLPVHISRVPHGTNTRCADAPCLHCARACKSCCSSLKSCIVACPLSVSRFLPLVQKVNPCIPQGIQRVLNPRIP